MSKRSLLRKSLVWGLIAAIANPLQAVAPAHARDTDIFLAVTPTATTAEPNVLIILDTSDTMNIPEPWREYAGGYDSHVEYLWNDIGRIRNTEITTEHAHSISTAVPPVVPWSVWGTWAGATLAERRALWTAARDHANATHPGDPGPRHTWRNYHDANWIYWLPAGTDDTDPRLMSLSFNRWAGGTRVIGGTRGGINYGGSSTMAGFNQCQTSVSQIMPSTVFAPSNQPRNAGVWLNQQWQRWERFLDLDSSRVASYPLSDPIATSGRTIATGSGTGNIGSTNVNPRADYAASDPALITSLVRDNSGANTPFGSNATPGSLGQPIRIRIDHGSVGVVDPGDSRAGWTNLRADTGGFHYFNVVNSLSAAQMQTVLSAIYGVTQTTAEARWRLYRGRDTQLADSSLNFGTPAYHNTPATTGDIAAGSSTLTLTANNNGYAVGNIVNVPGAGLAGANLVAAITAVGGTGNRQLTLGIPASSAASGVPVTRNLRLTSGTPLTCTRTCNNSVTATAASPATDATGASHSWRPNTSTCVDGGVSGAGCGSVTPAACGAPVNNHSYTTVAYSGCAWSGRTAVMVEGIGTYFTGGQCTGSCVSRFPDACPAAGTPSGSGFCNNTSTPSMTINGITYSNVTLNNGGNGSNFQCANRANVTRTCSARPDPLGGTTCSYGRTCENVTASTGVPTTDHAVFNRAAADDFLVHDCRADNGTPGNPASGFLSAAANRTFGTAHNSVSSTSGTTASYTPVDPGASYPALDMYSVNWLNWRHGPRGPNGHPIGRKTRLQIAKNALTDLIQGVNGVRVGLMVYNRTRADLTNDGANIALGIRRMGSNSSDPDFANRALLAHAINSATAAARTPLTESLYEAYLYFAGRAPQWGTDASAAFIGGTASQGRDTAAVCTAVGPGCPSVGVYRSPMLNNPSTADPAACQKNFIVLITDGGPEDDASSNSIGGTRGVRHLSWNDLAAGTTIGAHTAMDSTVPDTSTGQFEAGAGVPFGPTDLGGTTVDGGFVWLDELAYFMSRADISPGARNFSGETSTDLITGRQSVITHTIGFAGANSPVVQNAAVRSGGTFYLAEDSAQLAAALTAAFDAIRNWNPTMSAPTIPIAALSRTQNATEVYLSFFGPSPSQTWDGTVKKYRVGDPGTDPGVCGTTQSALCLIGQTVLQAPNSRNIEQTVTDPVTGLQVVDVNPDTVSFWGPITLRDGGRPNEGGTGFQLVNTPGYTPANRRIYTRLASATTADLLDASNAFSEDNATITKGLLGNAAMSDATRATLINWMRGGNPGNSACSDSTSATACTTWRSWAHFDVQHSRPAVVSYDGTLTPPRQFLFYASSGGKLHAVDANTGREQWAFVVEEALPHVAALMADQNGPQIYVADASPVVRFEDANQNGIVEAGDRVWLYFGLRRGGRAYYALDITDPAAPRFKWKITPTSVCGASGCAASSVYAELGESWSTPVIGRVAAVADPVMIFGGGYDPNQDHRPASAPDSMGRAVYVVNARTGELEMMFNASHPNVTSASFMTFSMPSDPAVMDSDGDGHNYLDRIYIGDMGGNVWRFDIGSPDKSLWGGRLLARLATGAPTERKIFFPPAAVKQQRAGVRYDAVVVGTGNRENPLNTGSSDIVAVIKDLDHGLYSTGGPPATVIGGDFVDLGTAAAGVNESTFATDPSIRGWIRPLDAGEKVINAPTVFFGRIRFGTYAPLAQLNACIPPGQGRINELDLLGGLGIMSGTTPMRYDPTFLTRSYSSTGQIIVLPPATGTNARRVFYITVADSRLRGQFLGTIGGATRVYWYVEGERT